MLNLRPRPLDRRDPDFRELRDNRIAQARRDYHDGLMTTAAFRRALLGYGLSPQDVDTEIRGLLRRDV